MLLKYFLKHFNFLQVDYFFILIFFLRWKTTTSTFGVLFYCKFECFSILVFHFFLLIRINSDQLKKLNQKLCVIGIIIIIILIEVLKNKIKIKNTKLRLEFEFWIWIRIYFLFFFICSQISFNPVLEREIERFA